VSASVYANANNVIVDVVVIVIVVAVSAVVNVADL
jgi:hypothetical protein